VRIGGRPRPAFRLCGLAGTAIAIAVGLALAAAVDASVAVMAAVCAAACGAFLVLAVAARGRLVYYHHEAAVLGVAALLPWALGEPVLPYMDAAAVGLGAFLACGRVGCLLAGCCHGRPAARGVRYGTAHAVEGFPAHLVGVSLVPVQALESAGVLVIAAVGAGLVLDGADPGAALAWYGTAYAVLRFGLELLRGDAARPYLAGLSAAQWISLAIAAAVALAGAGPVYTAAAIALGVAAVALAVTAPRRRLLGARHVAELAAALEGPGVSETSLGLRVSSGRDGGDWHCTLSMPGAPLPDRTAEALGTIVGRLRRATPPRLLRGPTGAVHVVIPDG
jgi:hypothetical protein